MKNIYLALMLVFFVVFVACNEGENDSISKNENEIIEDLEEEITYNNLEDSVYISEEWADLDYDSCVAYFCKDFYKYYYIVDEETNKLNDSVRIIISKKIKEDDSHSLIKVFSEVHSNLNISDCLFQPRHAFVFYRKDKVVAHSSICMSCWQHASIPKSGIDFKVVENVLNNAGLPSTKGEIWKYYNENEIEEVSNH